ncbi:hypothetical protein F9Z77_21795, partial [Escherichia coli]
MYIRACGRRISIIRSSCEQFLSAYQAALSDYLRAFLIGTVAKLAMRQPFVLFKGLTFQKLCLPGAF